MHKTNIEIDEDSRGKLFIFVFYFFWGEKSSALVAMIVCISRVFI